jgi:integrase
MSHNHEDGDRRKRRRPRGSGSVFLIGRLWWIAYRGPDGRRIAESSESQRKGDAERLLQRRNGAREHNLPVIPKAERLTFDTAAQSVIDDFTINGKRSGENVRQRFDNHLKPFLSGRRMAGITATDVIKYVAHRQQQGITNRKGERVRDVSNAEINRELALLKRTFSLAIKSGLLAMRPHIPMLRESAPRSGFLEREQIASVVAHLPPALRPVIQFTYVTGWRINSEVLPLEWHQVDFKAGEVKLLPGTTKNGEGRTFPMTADLRSLLEGQQVAHEKLKKSGHIIPQVFWRMVADKRRGPKKPKPIKAFKKAWVAACNAAGCPGRIPHDMRRSSVRNLVRAGIPERVAMMMTGHKTRSVFERYNIVSDGDLKDAARKLDALAARPRRTKGRAEAV